MILLVRVKLGYKQIIITYYSLSVLVHIMSVMEKHYFCRRYFHDKSSKIHKSRPPKRLDLALHTTFNYDFLTHTRKTLVSNKYCTVF